jgi:hypothetical protein
MLGTLEAHEVFLLKCLVVVGQEHVLSDDLDRSHGYCSIPRWAPGPLIITLFSFMPIFACIMFEQHD